MSLASSVNGYFIGESLTPKNCYDLWDVLFKYGHVNSLLCSIDPADTSLLHIKEVLTSICGRTLVFGKPFEYITASSLGQTDPDLGICAIPIALRPITRSIAALKKAGLLICFGSSVSAEWVIGLDFYNIVVKLYSWVKKGTNTKLHRVVKAKEILKEMLQSKAFVGITKNLQVLQGKRFPSGDSSIRKELDTMCALLSDQLKVVDVRESKRLAKKEAKVASAVLLGSEEVTKADAEVFLVNWKKTIIDSGLYPHYDMRSELMDHKMFSCIKAFLKAEFREGTTWEQLKAELRVLIDGWGRIPPKARHTSAISGTGKPYNVVLKAFPTFMEYWNNRSVLRGLCKQYSTLQMPTHTKMVVEAAASISPDVDEESIAFDL